MSLTQPVLAATAISKRFPGVVALDAVTFDLRAGEVHALMGENGAGKSTLIKIITGAYRRDEGMLTVDGKEVDFAAPSDSQSLGIVAIYQEFSQVASLSVAENIFLGEWPMRQGRIDWTRMNAEAQALLDRFAVDADPRDTLSSLGVATRQMVEILKTIRKPGVRILIMDEPTSALSDQDTERLFTLIRKLRDEGVAIIYISHRLHEIMQICDRITVFRNGRNVGTLVATETTIDDIVTMMVGRELNNRYPAKGGPTRAEVAVEVKGLADGNRLAGIDLKAHKGEVLGLTGLVGAGKTETLRAIFGADPVIQGQVLINGSPAGTGGPAAAIARGVGLIPESRKEQGLVLPLTLVANAGLASLSQKLFSLRDRTAERSRTTELIGSLQVSPPDPQNRVANLSGGNQQKIVLAKWLMRQCDVLLFDEPTRGIDVGAKYQIYSLIAEAANAGKCVIVASSDIDEIAGICSRVLVLSDGAVVGELTGENIEGTAMTRLLTGTRGG